jgi:cytochrome c553
MRLRRPLLAACLLAPLAGARPALAHHHIEFRPPPPFGLSVDGLGGVAAAAPAPAYLASSRIAAVGDGALAIDADSGALVSIGSDGALIAQLAIGRDAGQLAYDPVTRRAYVADRRGGRVVVVEVAAGGDLAQVATWPAPAEPYAVALTPDRTTVLVAAIADRALVAYDAANGRERWRVAIGKEPRAIAIAPDGARAIVPSLATAGVDEIDLAQHTVRRAALPGEVSRGAFAATFVGALAAVSYQLDNPSASDPEFGVNEGAYGGGFLPPVHHFVALAAAGGEFGPISETSAKEIHALAWDGAHDALYLAGFASDSLVQVDRASQVDPAARAEVHLSKPTTGAPRCGPDGLAVSPGGDVLVWCAFSRSLVRVAPRATGAPLVSRGASLVASAMSDDAHLGYELFHTATDDISQHGAIACGTCHLDGRTDGVSWLIHGVSLQTPLLAGRVAGTEPYKWDGDARDLHTSLIATVERLGGSGLSAQHLTALAAYLEAMPAVTTPTRDVAQVARGRALFESADLGCTNCHDGAAYTDGLRHRFRGTLPASDTPSLIGLAASAPYLHDGSAATLETVVRDHGLVHGMIAPSVALTDAQVADLTAFLESL